MKLFLSIVLTASLFVGCTTASQTSAEIQVVSADSKGAESPPKETSTTNTNQREAEDKDTLDALVDSGKSLGLFPIELATTAIALALMIPTAIAICTVQKTQGNATGLCKNF